MTMRRRAIGIAGEKAARCYLEEKGYQVIDLNYRCPLGEIDIVARDGSTVVFVEVRTRTGECCGSPAESVTPGKIRRLEKLARHFMQRRYGREVPGRFDLVAVQMDPRDLSVSALEHFCNITSG